MHPYLVEQLAQAHQQELRAAAGRPGERHHSERQRHRRSPRGSARNRAGWLLVEIGLRLARGPGGA
jgi:hypothetical protein